MDGRMSGFMVVCAAPDASMELAWLKGNCGKFAWSNEQGQAIRNCYCNDRCCGHYKCNVRKPQCCCATVPEAACRSAC